jgi:hypothetical protein
MYVCHLRVCQLVCPIGTSMHSVLLVAQCIILVCAVSTTQPQCAVLVGACSVGQGVLLLIQDKDFNGVQFP